MTTKSLCEHCIFAIRDKNIQVGCQFGRLDKFRAFGQAEYNPDTLSYEIANYCSTLRNTYWKHDREEEGYTHDIATLAEIALNEEAITYYVVISADGVSRESLKSTVAELKGLKYKPTKIILFASMTEDNRSLSDLADKLVYVSLSIYSNPFMQCKYLIQQSESAGYILFIDPRVSQGTTTADFTNPPAQQFNSGIIETANNMINVDLKPLLYHIDGNSCLVSAILYKTYINNENPIHEVVRMHGPKPVETTETKV